MNYPNTLVIAATLIIWTQLIHFTVPTAVGRTILGIFGAVIIGATFSTAGISAFQPGGFVLV